MGMLQHLGGAHLMVVGAASSLDLVVPHDWPVFYPRTSTPTSWNGSDKPTRRHECHCPRISVDTRINIGTSADCGFLACRGRPGEIGFARNRRTWKHSTSIVIGALVMVLAFTSRRSSPNGA